MRQIFLDTETTGLDPNQGHRIIEIAAIEIQNRQQTNNRFHAYLNPEEILIRQHRRCMVSLWNFFKTNHFLLI